MEPEDRDILSDVVTRVVSDALDAKFGAAWIEGDTLSHVRGLADLLAESWASQGKGSCVKCSALTDSWWLRAPMCGECQQRNPCVQQMKGWALRASPGSKD